MPARKGAPSNNAKYFREHPEEYAAYKKRCSEAQKNFIKNNPERFREIQRMGSEKMREIKRKKWWERYELRQEENRLITIKEKEIAEEFFDEDLTSCETGSQ